MYEYLTEIFVDLAEPGSHTFSHTFFVINVQLFAAIIKVGFFKYLISSSTTMCLPSEGTVLPQSW